MLLTFQIVGVIGGVLSILNLLWIWHGSAQLPTKAGLNELDGKVDAHALRLQAIENEMRHLPSKDDLHAVKNAVTEMLGQMRVVEAELNASSRTLRRLEDHMRGEKA